MWTPGSNPTQHVKRWVTKLAAKKISVACKDGSAEVEYNRETGSRKGADKYSPSTDIVPITDIIRDEWIRRTVLHAITNTDWKTLPTETLVAIRSLIEKKGP